MFVGGLPTQIANFAVTYKCDSRCVNCNIWKKPSVKPELTLRQIEAFFSTNYLILKKVKSIQVTGGEPFLRNDLPEIIKIIRRFLPECFIWIPTNGLNPNRVAYMVKTITTTGKSLGVSISIDGIGLKNDSQRGVTGSYQKSLDTLKKLIEIREKKPGLLLSIGFTLSAENFYDLLDVQRLAYSHDVDFSIRPVNVSEIYYNNTEKKVLDEALVDVLIHVSKASVKRKGLARSLTSLAFLHGIPNFLISSKNRPIRCTTGTSSFFLDPYGNVYPCIVYNRKMGNITKSSFSEIWFSSVAEKIRNDVYNLKCPGCWVECETFRDINKDKRYLATTLLKTILSGSPF